MADHGVEYFEGILVGVQKGLDDLQKWLVRFEDGHKKEMETLYARMAVLEAKMTHENARSAAWNQIYGFIGAAILASLTFFSGALNNLFHHSGPSN